MIIVDYFSSLFHRICSDFRFYLSDFYNEPLALVNWLKHWEMVGILLCGAAVALLVIAHDVTEGKRWGAMFRRITIYMAVASGIIIFLFLIRFTPKRSNEMWFISAWSTLKTREFRLYYFIPLFFAWMIAFIMGTCLNLFFRLLQHRQSNRKQATSRLYAIIILLLLLVLTLGNHFGLWTCKLVISRYEHTPVMMREDHPNVYLLNKFKDRASLRIFSTVVTLLRDVPIYREMSVKSEQVGVLLEGDEFELANVFPTTRRGWRYDQNTGCFVQTEDLLRAVSLQRNISHSLFEKFPLVSISMLFEYDLYGITFEFYESGKLRGHLFVSPDLSYIMPTLDIFVVLVSLLLLAIDAYYSSKRISKGISHRKAHYKA